MTRSSFPQFEVEVSRSNGAQKERYQSILGGTKEPSPGLPSGLYFSRWRELNARGKPGPWSQYEEHFVQPKAPVLLSPASQQVRSRDLKISWAPSPGAVLYRLILRKDSQDAYNEVFSGTEQTIRRIPSGRYRILVLGVIPAAKAGEFWEGEPSDPKEIQVEPVELVAVWPKGRMLGGTEPLPFSWTTNDPGLAFQLELFEKRTGESTWEAISQARVQGSLSSRQLAGVLPPGEYRWKLRATDPDFKETIASTQSSFSIDSMGQDRPGHGWIGVGYDILNWAYSSESGEFASRFGANVGGPAVAVSLALENRLNLRVSYRISTFALEGQSRALSALAAGVSWRPRLFESGSWFVTLGMQVERGSLPQVFANSDTTISQGQVERLLVSPSAQAHYLLNERILVFAELAASTALGVFGGILGEPRETQPGLHFSLSAGAQFPLAWPLSMAVRAALLQDGLSYTGSSGDFRSTFTGYRLSTCLQFGF